MKLWRQRKQAVTTELESKTLTFRIKMSKAEYDRFVEGADSFLMAAIKNKDEKLLRGAEGVQALKSSLTLAMV